MKSLKEMKGICLSIGFLLGCVNPTLADLKDLKICQPDNKKKDQCLYFAEKLHPTQFAVGMLMVEEKKSDLNKLKKEEYEAYLKAHPVPVMIGPDGVFYPTDHHHLARAVLELGKSFMVVEVKENWKNLEKGEFWKKMIEAQFVYLYDENGQGPLLPEKLPVSMMDLKDDPYRSLAALSREKNCYDKSDQPFAEFKWAQFFRSKIKIEGSDKKLKNAVKDSLRLCHLPEAKDLPGYRNP